MTEPTLPPTGEFNGIPPLDPSCWLTRAFEYVRVRSKLPDYAVFWTLMAYCGAALKDRICVRWAGKTIFPNIPLLIVGESGLGKTSAINVVDPLFPWMRICKIPEDCTAEALTQYLAMERDVQGLFGNSCALWCVPELTDVFGTKDYQKGTVARLTRLLDNPRDFGTLRITRRDNPTIPGHTVLTWVAGTTVDWLRGYTDKSVGAGGFLPRLFVVNLADPPKCIPDPQPDPNIVQQLNAELVALFPPQPSAQEIVDLSQTKWNGIYKQLHQDHVDSLGTPKGPFAARKAENIIRIFLVFSKFARVRVSSHEFASEMRTANWLEDQGLRASFLVKMPEVRITIECILKYLGRHPQGMPYHLLSKNLHIPSKQLHEALVELRLEKDVEWDGSRGKESIVKLQRRSV